MFFGPGGIFLGIGGTKNVDGPCGDNICGPG